MAEDRKAQLERYFDHDSPADVLAVYLFGSHAEGRSHRESDVDVGVLLDRTRHPSPAARFQRRLELIVDLIGLLGTDRVDVIVLNDAPPELGRHVVTRGLRVSCRDPEADHAFVRDVQIRAADLAPFLRRMRRIKLESLRP